MTEFKMKAEDLRVNGLVHSLNIDTPQPVFSWRMDCARTGARQTAYQITVSARDTVVWDSGRVESDACFDIPYAAEAEALAPETDYTWKVTIWDETGASASSEAAFSTGLMVTDLSVCHGGKLILPD